MEVGLLGCWVRGRSVVVWLVWEDLVPEGVVVEENMRDEVHVVRDNRSPEIELELS